MINHRLLKAIIKGETIARPQDEATVQMAERRRLNRMAERDVADWLYARFLNDKAGTDTRFAAEIIDVSRGGMRVRLVDNGAVAFIRPRSSTPCATNWCAVRRTVPCRIKGEVVYKVTDVIDVTIAEVRMETRRRSCASGGLTPLHSGSCGNRCFFPLYPAISVAPIKVVRFFRFSFHSFLASLISFVFVTG